MQIISKASLLIIVFISIIQSIQAQQNDTIILKNGIRLAGYIYKMDESGIYIVSENDSSKYSADEVKMLMFCHTVGTANNCAGKSTSTGTVAKIFSNSSRSGDKNSYTERDGDVQFTCTQCGGRGRIEIINTAHPGIVIDQFMVSLDEGESYFSYKTGLLSGEYEWRYCDTRNHTNSGNFIIEKDSNIQVAVFKH